MPGNQEEDMTSPSGGRQYYSAQILLDRTCRSFPPFRKGGGRGDFETPGPGTDRANPPCLPFHKGGNGTCAPISLMCKKSAEHYCRWGEARSLSTLPWTTEILFKKSPYYPSTYASAASARGSQNVISIARYNSMATDSSARACSGRPNCVYRMPRPQWQWAWSGRIPSASARARACW
jgi:hypothetical protein